MVAVCERAGDNVLITHSSGGVSGWTTAIKGELPAVEDTTSPFPAAGQGVSREEFMRLTKIPIVVYFGDNIPNGDKPVANWGFDNRRTRLNLARKWAAVVNSCGGDVEIVCLPDVGVTGSTHFMMADLNNVAVADVMNRWLKSKGLAN